MSFSLVQNVGIGTSGAVASFTKSWSVGPTSGNLIVVVCWAFGNGSHALLGAGTVTDNKGNTFSLAVTKEQGSATISAAVHYLIAPSTYSSYTVTVAPTGSALYYINVDCLEFSTTGVTPTLNVTATGASNTQPVSGTTATTDANCGLWVAALGLTSTTTQSSISTPSGFTDAGKQLTGASSQVPGSGSYAITGSLASVAASASWTVGTAVFYGAAIATFTSAPSAVTTDVTTSGALSTTDTADATSTATTTAAVTHDVTTSAAASMTDTKDATTSADLAVGHSTDATTTGVTTVGVHADATTSLVATRSVVSNLDLSTAATVIVTHDLTSSAALAASVHRDLTMDAVIVVPRLSVTSDAAIKRTVSGDVTSSAVIAVHTGTPRSFAVVIG